MSKQPNFHRSAVVVVCAALSLIFCFCAASASAWAATPAVVISQVYGGGGNSGATWKNDFIELFNPGVAPVSVTGWSVQYTSSSGTSWQKTNLTGTIPAGTYFLVQEAAGTGGTTVLPTADAIGTIAMSATGAKVALVNNQTALTGACPTAGVVDFVGYDGANCPTPAPTVKFQLRNASGALITTASSVLGIQMSSNPACSGVGGTPFPAASTGGTTLRFAGDSFIFNWQTEKSWTSCYNFLVTLDDGTTQSALVTMK